MSDGATHINSCCINPATVLPYAWLDKFKSQSLILKGKMSKTVQNSEFCFVFVPPTSGYVFIRRQIQVSSLFCHLVFSQSCAGVCRVRYRMLGREANRTAGRASCRTPGKQPPGQEKKVRRPWKCAPG